MSELQSASGIDAIADKRAGDSLALKQAWRYSLQRMISTGISIEQTERLAGCCESPAMAMRLGAALDGGQAGYQRLLEAVDESPYSLRDWVKALDVLQQWLERHPRRSNMEHRVGYISCCVDSEPGVSLSEVVEQMLKEYGYEGVE